MLNTHLTNCLVVLGFLFFCHVVHTNHVAVSHEHKHREVQDLRVQLEMTCNALVKGVSPEVTFLEHFRREHTDAIAPKMTHLSHLSF